MRETADEVTLVARSIDGDADAFGALYERHLDAIFRYVYYRVGDTREAEDLAEQVFLRAWEAISHYRQRSTPFSSWLYRIAHNAVVDFHRDRKWIVPVPSHELLEIRSERPSSVQQVIAAEEAARLASAIGQLSEEQQQVVVLRFVEGLGHAEVARVLGKSPGACRVIQHRALAALGRLLGEM
jgi:RNA polymerase sigma-70 factor (ECF subfamily)